MIQHVPSPILPPLLIRSCELQVLYPGLPSHPQHALAVRQTRGHSGMITFYLRGGLAAARAFLESTKVRPITFPCASQMKGAQAK